jgi:hypothetical protein
MAELLGVFRGFSKPVSSDPSPHIPPQQTTDNRPLYLKRTLQHHLALPRSTASVFGRLWASFEHVYARRGQCSAGRAA